MLVTLNNRSHFSVGESLLSPEQIVKQAIEAKYTHVALTDTMQINGLPALFNACKDTEITPIIGVRLRIVDVLFSSREDRSKYRPYYLRVIVRRQEAYDAILKMLSLSYDEQHFFEVPRLLLSDVCDHLANVGDACIVTLGDFYGALATGKAQDVVSSLRAINVPVVSEILPYNTPYFERLTYEAIKLQQNLDVPSILSLPSFYESEDHADSLDLMRSICLSLPFDERSNRHPHRSYITPTIGQIRTLLVEHARALSLRYGHDAPFYLIHIVAANTFANECASSCTYKWVKSAPSLPKMAEDERAELIARCAKGWKERFNKSIYGYKPENLEPYVARLRYELEVLTKLKFEGYFLLVSDITSWSRSVGISVGPGRGSVGGSLVAFLLGITDVDPIRFGLLFERFINPDRIDLPDADLDFMASRRKEVTDWIRGNFGDDYVAAVSNYISIAGAGALKDVSSKLGVSAFAFGGYVPKEHGKPIPLSDALTAVPELAKFAADNPSVIKHALILENKIKSYGQHAAGMIVAGTPLNERAVVERRNSETIVNWDKSLVEEFGLIKMDILGLATLDMIEETRLHIFHTHGKKIDLHDIPLDDPKTLAEFGEGHTVGVFQFESYGMRKLLRDLADQGPLNFEDLTAATALYRPGPMDSGLMETFVQIKQGLKLPGYPHPSMELALIDTYGVMVYQEQVMRVSQDFAGFSLVDADHLRKIMGKKQKDKMPKWRTKFVEGAVKLHGVEAAFAENIFDQIEKFAGYGFNKSHASAYTLISYLCMWLKVNYPVEFFCGLLSSLKSDRRSTALNDMRRLGIKVIPPDINISGDHFIPLNPTELIAPFNAVKGISDRTTNAILQARKLGAFKSIKDFEDRVDKRACNVKHRSLLDQIGSFCSIDDTMIAVDHPDRRRDQISLLEGLIADAIIIDREMNFTATSLKELSTLIDDYKVCDRCELSGLCHPKPYIHGRCKAMLIIDGPSLKDEAADEIGGGSSMAAVEEALSCGGLTLDDVYVTSLIKSPKPEKEKAWSNRTLSECPTWVDREIALLKPSIIVLLGSKATNYFLKDKIRGGMADNAGSIIYDKERDCNFIVAINPGMVFFDPGKQVILDQAFAKIATLLPE